MDDKISTVIIGGTFNPIHIGHVHLIDEVSKALKPEKIFIVPAYISAHKQNCHITDAEHRLAMLEIACRDIEVVIETCELERKGISYSIDTIKHIKRKYNLTDKPGLLIGDDLAKGFKTWRNPDDIVEEAQLIIACRDSEEEIDIDYKHHRINNLMLNISSSDIRNRLSEGRACRFLLPSGVYDYIVTNKLYGENYA